MERSRFKAAVWMVLVFAALVSALPCAAETPPLKVSGLAFGDIYWFAQSNNPAYQGQNGFWLRRAYLTFDQQWNPAWSWQVRLEADQTDFASTTSTAATPFLKTAFVKWDWAGGQSLLAGLQNAPTCRFYESQWGYRCVERTPLDLEGWASSVDAGLGLQGTVAGLPLRYEALAADGSFQKSLPAAQGQGKRFYLSLVCSPLDCLDLQAEGDLQNKVNDSQDGLLTLAQAFACLHGGPCRLGLLYAQRDLEPSGGQAFARQELVSAFGVWKAGDRLSLFARVDQLLWENDATNAGWTYSPAGLPYLELATGRHTLGVAGVDFAALDQLHVIPNLEMVSYESQSGEGVPAQDVIPRLTFSVTY